MKKFALYTARFGTPGRFNFPEVSTSDVDKFCFTDLDIEPGIGQKIPTKPHRYVKNDFYQVKKMNLDQFSSVPTRRQRWIKICIPDEIFDNYEYSVYVDCKRPFAVDFELCLNNLGSQSDFLTRQHQNRDCVYDEGAKCIEVGKGIKEVILKQLDFYRGENYPSHNGLYWTAFLFRRHTKELKEFSKRWWAELEKRSFRDQLSLPYVAWKYGVKISLLPYKKFKGSK